MCQVSQCRHLNLHLEIQEVFGLGPSIFSIATK